VEVKKNEPLLTDVRAPWDPEYPVGRRKPKDLWKRACYVHKYGVFWAPAWMDPGTYKDLLRDLDRVALRSLKKEGALTAKELAGRLNRWKGLRTKPKRTGIHQVTPATVYAWLDFASRRGLVVAWPNTPGRSATSRTHWELTEKGQEALRSKFWFLLGRFYPLLPALLASGALLGIFKLFSVHPGVVVWTLLALPVILEIVVLAFLWIRSERREAPRVAVVAIETLRSAGKPLPVLGASSR
jgi:DNA-binding PadR family transcriptional regulator